MACRIVPFKVRRLGDGAEFTLHKVYRRVEDSLADVASPDGRMVDTPDEVNFYFGDEPDRAMQVISE